MKLKILIGLLLATVLSLVPAIASAEDGDGDKGALLRIRGDVDVPAGQTIDAVIVLDGNLTFAGTADLIVVVHGTATISGTVNEQVVVGNGKLVLAPGANVKDVTLYSSDLEQANGATITGKNESKDRFTVRGPWGLLTALARISLFITLLAAGLLFAAVAGPLLSRTARSLTDEPSSTVIATIVFWLVIPVVAFFIAFTIVGIGLTVGLLFLMLVLGFLGYFVFATRVGAWLLSFAHRPMGEHPYLAVAAGIILIQLLTLIPVVQFIAGIAVFLGCIWGAGALALMAWRSARGHTQITAPMTPAA